MSKNPPVRIRQEHYNRLQRVGQSHCPPSTVTALINEIVRQALPKWERGYIRRRVRDNG